MFIWYVDDDDTDDDDDDTNDIDDDGVADSYDNGTDHDHDDNCLLPLNCIRLASSFWICFAYRFENGSFNAYSFNIIRFSFCLFYLLSYSITLSSTIFPVFALDSSCTQRIGL